MKIFLVVISMWGSNGSEWVYMGNQYVMKELFTLKQCEKIISSDNWKKHETNEYYKIQLECKKKGD
tara:strand:+ start:384 stop:581 length:198 start_codon:yes stop_codon:yes gene_type:complete